MSREQLRALHGDLVLRVVDRMMQFRFDRLKAAVGSGKGNPDNDCPDHLNRYAEGTALVAIIQAHKGLTEILQYRGQVEGDECDAYCRLYALSEGHTLTKEDILDIEAVLAEYNDEIGNQADKANEIRMAAFREIGGDDLVKAIEAKDEALISAAVERAMEKFRAAAGENAACP